jgi:SAM-dependent methyltransferase
LCECRRLLRPGGRLILSTHGIYEEHGLPYDFRRWTGDGLRAELEQHGLEVRESYRLTTSGRALAFLIEQHGETLVRSRRNLPGFLAWGLHTLVSRNRERFHHWCDAAFDTSRVVDCSTSSQSLAVGLLFLCVRPS